MATVTRGRSPVRFDIRLSENGEPYLEIVYNFAPYEVLAKTECYASGVRGVRNAIRRLQEGAATAEVQDRRDEGPIGRAAEED